GRLKSPWSRRKRKHVLTPQQWKSVFTQDGGIRDGGIKFMKRVRSGGVDPSIRAEVWPFLLGVYDLDSTKEERDAITTQNRKEYEKLRRQCRQLLKHSNGSFKLNEIASSPSFLSKAHLGGEAPSSKAYSLVDGAASYLFSFVFRCISMVENHH
ncbi:GTPase-activating protein gyp7, partial [Glycine soja]